MGHGRTSGGIAAELIPHKIASAHISSSFADASAGASKPSPEKFARLNFASLNFSKHNASRNYCIGGSMAVVGARKTLATLPAGFHMPVVVEQHMPGRFLLRCCQTAP